MKNFNSLFRVLTVAIIVITLTTSCGNNSSTETTSKTEDNSVSDNKNWDKVLDDYEKYVDQYVEVYKKVLAGDNSILAESATLLEKAGDLEKSLKKAQEDKNFTTEHAARMLRIQDKMLKAMQPAK